MSSIIKWAYNELAADMHPDDLGFSLHFPGPEGTGSSTEEFLVNLDSEELTCAAWDAFANRVATDCGDQASSPVNIKRGLNGTQIAKHLKGTPVWIREIGTEPFSAIGRWKFQAILTTNLDKEIETFTWYITNGVSSYPDPENVIATQDVTEFLVKDNNIYVPGPDISLPNPDTIYGIIARVDYTDGSGTTLTHDFTGLTVENVYVIPDGTETGDPYDDSSVFSAPTIGVLGNTYTVTLANQTDSPVSTNDTYFYRLYAITPDEMDEIDINWGAFNDNITFSGRNFYQTRIYDNRNSASFTLTIDLKVAGVSTHTETIMTHPAASTDEVRPDQVQVERQVRIDSTFVGSLLGRWSTDWQPVPETFEIEYANQGSSDWEFRYRFRYRDFRRDGTNIDKGPIQITSDWSSWSSWT